MNKLLSILNLLAAVVVAVSVDVLFPDAFTNAEQYFLGLGVFTALTLVEILILLRETESLARNAASQRTQQEKAWEARTELDTRLQQIQRHFHQLDAESGNKTDLFYEYHKKKLTDFEKSIRDACLKRETQIDETMFSVTTWLLGIFRGRDEDLLRAVMPTSSLDFFFDVHPRTYFSQTWELIQNKSCVGVRRLIVVDDNAHLADPRLHRLVEFHERNERYSCRAITRVAYERIITDYRLPYLLVDFGIYGSSYVYKALSSQEDKIIGIYSKDTSEIAEFIACFQSCWDAGESLAYPIAPKRRDLPTIEWLFGTRPFAVASLESEGEIRVVLPESADSGAEEAQG